MSKFLSFSTIYSDSVNFTEAEEKFKLNETLMNENNEEDVDLIFKSTSIVVPSVRHLLSRKAYFSYERNEEVKTTFYQTEMLCLGIRSSVELSTTKDKNDNLKELFNNLPDLPSPEIPDDINTPDWMKQLISIVQKHEQNQIKPKSKQMNHIFNFDPNFGYPLMAEQIKQLPNEWTVLQLCKGYNPEASFSNFTEILNFNADIYISLIRYPRWERNNFQPICIKLKALDNENIYQKMSEAREGIFNNIADKSKHHQGLVRTEQQFKQIINSLKQKIGPWICLFYGQHDESLDLKVYALVDKFCQRNGFLARDNILIGLMARKIFLLSSDDIKRGAEFISADDNNIKLISLFLIELKCMVKPATVNELPVILIIDEYLDYFPWEMIVPAQETTRFASLQLLLHLTGIYRDSIKNGYLERTVRVANAVINPESNLPDCEKRMVGFIKEIFPNWNIVAGKRPESNELSNILSTSDIYTYMGHGSGLQLMGKNKISEQRVPGIVFLFGCSSVALMGHGFNNEMTGCHNYYHLGLCPAIVGMNYIVTDNAADAFSSDLLADFVYSKAGSKWKKVNMLKWRKGEICYDGVGLRKESSQNGNLLALLAKHRVDEKFHQLRLRVAIICRGLPVKLVK